MHLLIVDRIYWGRLGGCLFYIIIKMGNTHMKLRTLLYGFIASVALATAAFGADLPPIITKGPAAAPVATCVAGNCSGWFAGFGLVGNGTNADIVGNGINGSVFAAGGAVEIHGGYQFWNGSLFAAVEAVLDYEFSSPSSAGVPVANNSFGNSIGGMELVKLGYNFFPSTQSATTTPSQSPVPLIVPANLLAATTPYFVFGGHQRRGASMWVNGAGMETVVASGWTSFAEYLYAPSQQGLNSEQIVRVGIDKHF